MSKQIYLLKENSHILGAFETEKLANDAKNAFINEYEKYKRLKENIMLGKVETYLDSNNDALINHVDYQGMSLIELYGIVNSKKLYTVTNYTVFGEKECQLPFDELRKLLR